MEYYFETDDKLERKKYAEFLKSMLENCDKYRREDSDGAYVIAIDSPWGTGKTRFAKMLRNFLEGREPNVVDGKADQRFIPNPNENRKFNVIYYNSWETDYWNDALEPLIYSIYESRVLEIEGAEADNAKIKSAILQILKGIGIALLKLALGDPAAGVFQGALDGMAQVPNDPLAAFKERMTQYGEFQNALESVIERTNKKLVIIIDELDRCRPTFAIQTLELVKHLFAVKGLIFIFSLDIKQLSCSVKTVYGQDLDATGYLCRFFDYSVKLPTEDVRVFIEELLLKADSKAIFDKMYKKYDGVDARTDFIEFVYEISERAMLSFRDLTTIFETFHLMIDSFLKQYHWLEAFKLYFIILIIKYKFLDLFKGLFLEKRITEEAGGYFKRHLGFDLDRTLVTKLMMIYDSKVINSRAFKITGVSGENLGGGTTINSVSGDASSFTIAWNLNNEDPRRTQTVNYKQECRFDGILYNQDIIKWDDIKNLTLAQYYHQQLEMFNFALPADEPEPNA